MSKRHDIIASRVSSILKVPVAGPTRPDFPADPAMRAQWSASMGQWVTDTCEVLPFVVLVSHAGGSRWYLSLNESDSTGIDRVLLQGTVKQWEEQLAGFERFREAGVL